MKLLTVKELDTINGICNDFGIENYTINLDGSIDVNGNVFLIRQINMTELPLRFNKVNGDFLAQMSGLTTLTGAPQYVSGDFKCFGLKKLLSLEGGPKHVDGDYDSHNCDLVSLIGGPKHVGKYFNTSLNRLKNLIGAPHTIGGDFNLQNNKLSSLFCGDTDIDLGGDFYISNNPLPTKIIKAIKYDHLGENKGNTHSVILKYQRHFEIWNADYSLNELNFKDLITEIKDGLL